MDIVRQLRGTAVKVALEKEMAPYAAWKEDSELLYRAANEIEIRSELDKRDEPLQKAFSEAGEPAKTEALGK